MTDLTANLSAEASQFGDTGLPSQIDEYVKLFGFDAGLKDIVGQQALADIANALPMIEYDPGYGPSEYGAGNFLKFDSPNLSVPGYGSFDLKAYAGFYIDLGVYLHYGYDIGKIDANVTVTAPRVDGEVARTVYTLDTASTNVTARVDGVAGTGPFFLDLLVAGNHQGENGVPYDGRITAGLLGAGIYKNGNPYFTNDFGIDQSINAVTHITDPVYPGQEVASFQSSYLSGFLNVPQMPALSVHAGGTGAAAFDGEGQGGADGPAFAQLTLKPINLIPVVGQFNEQHLNILQSPLIDAGLDYKIIGLDISATALLHQELTVDIASVTVRAEAWENTAEDLPGDPDRSALDAADGSADGWVLVDLETGTLGDSLELGNFSQGVRTETRIDEYYSVTLRVHTDISMLLKGSVDFSFLTLSAFINPILIPELRLNLGPLFQANYSLTLGEINLVDDWFDITFASEAKVTHTITTIVDITGTPGDDADLVLVPGQVQIDALAGDDSVTGNDIGNAIHGGLGNDTVNGASGNDTIQGGRGRDSLLGGTGNDSIDVGAGSFDGEYVNGGAGNDTITVGRNQGEFFGGTEDDRIEVILAPGQMLDGGPGTDILVADAGPSGFIDFNLDFTVDGCIAFNAMFPATVFTGFERIDFTASAGADTIRGTVQSDTISGAAGDDSLLGDWGNDVLNGGDGSDTILGGSGFDELYGGAGDDSLDGGDQADIAYGGAGADTIAGGSGDDTLRGGDGNDSISDTIGGANRLYGDAGNDTITGGGANTVVDGGAGADRLTAHYSTVDVHGGAGDDTIIAITGGDILTGGGGSDRIVVSGKGEVVNAFGGDFFLVVSGGEGGDTGAATTTVPIFFTFEADVLQVTNFSSASSTGVGYVAPVSLPGAVTVLGDSGTLANGTTWSGFEAFDISGDAYAQYLVAGSFADTLLGQGGNDFLDGGDGGRDFLDGGTGNDTIVGGFGDTLLGGSGTDLLVFDPGSRGFGFELALGQETRRLDPLTPGSTSGPYLVVVERIGTASDGTEIANVEQLMMIGAGSGNDTISGAALGDTLEGGAGNDRLDGFGGDDAIDGGSGSDSIHGGAGADTIVDTGNAASGSGDTIFGDAGNDLIYGDHHAAEISGGAGNDTINVLNGGIAADGVARPVLDGGEGSDLIGGSDLSELIIGGDDPIDSPVPGADFTGLTAAQLRSYDGNDTLFGFGGADSILGGTGNDSVDGGAGSDTIAGGSGNDALDGGADDDSISGGSGDDTLHGSTGGDTIDGGDGADLIIDVAEEWPGTLSGDELLGGAGNDTIRANHHAATINGGSGADHIQVYDGGAPADGVWAPVILGELGSDLIEGSSLGEVIHGGFATIPAEGVADAGRVIAANDGNDTVMAMGGNDSVDGGSGADSIDGGDGADWLRGGLGNDTIRAGDNGDEIGDFIDGGDGNDLLTGSQGLDQIEGGAGADTIDGGLANTLGGGRDTLNGGTGSDSITAGADAVIDGGDGNDVIVLGDGAQEVVMTYGGLFAPGTDRVRNFTPGVDSVHFLGAGLSWANMVLTDTVEGLMISFGRADAVRVLLEGIRSSDIGPGSIVFSGSPVAGEDMVFVSDATSALVGHDLLLANDLGLGLAIGTLFDAGLDVTDMGSAVSIPATAVDGNFAYLATNADGSSLAFVNVGVIATTAGDDVIAVPAMGLGLFTTGSWIDLRAGNDKATGSPGADMLIGGDGDDTIDGSSGRDTLSGGAGKDSLTGGTGDDRLDGGDGDDVLIDYYGTNTLAGGDGNDTYKVESTDTVTIVETLNQGIDMIQAKGRIVLPLNVENALTLSLSGAEVTGNALANSLAGNAGADTITGNGGADKLLGYGGADSLDGGLGIDTLDGGPGSDTMTGGGSADRFLFKSADVAAIDVILDFSHAEGDLIDLSLMDAKAGISGNQAFVLVAAFSGAAGELVILPSGAMPGVYTVQGDVNGDGAADFSIEVTSATALVTGDFVL